MSPLERVTLSPTPGHPPCPETCWEKLDSGWRFVRPVNTACSWNPEQSRWTRCKENPSA
jgi:hypothetical protein